MESELFGCVKGAFTGADSNQPTTSARKKDDIPLLTDFFLSRLNRYYRKKFDRISPDTSKLLQNYPWPGNVRELEIAIEDPFVLPTEDTFVFKD